jgi:4-hydroxy-4-methyl-2-oxoglutarate aldolase
MPEFLNGLIARYEKLSSPMVYDILDKMGLPDQALDAAIKPLAPHLKVVGPAFTIVGGDDDGRDDGSAGYQMFRSIESGSVLVMAANGHRVSGPWGENASLSARMRGAKGMITDGGTRDAHEVSEMGFPLFCRYISPVFMLGRFAIKGHGQPIELDGQTTPRVTVRPGDLVFADRDGVVIVPAELAEQVLVAAEKLGEIEELLRAGLRAGEDRELVYKRHPKFAHVQRIR